MVTTSGVAMVAIGRALAMMATNGTTKRYQSKRSLYLYICFYQQFRSKN
jgi:hypothetical protein